MEGNYQMFSNVNNLNSTNIILAGKGMTGIEAQCVAVRESVNYFKNVVTPMNVGKNLECIHNDKSLIPADIIGMPKIPYKDPKVPAVPDYVLIATYNAAAPSHYKYRNLRCEICQENCNYRGVHLACCKAYVHYGCLHYTYRKAKCGLCPLCKWPIELGKNRLLDEIENVTITGNDKNARTTAVYKMLVDTRMVQDAEKLRRAYIEMERQLDFARFKGTLKSPDFFVHASYGMSYPTGTKCSLYLSEALKNGEPTGKISICKPTKKEAFLETVEYIINQLHKISKLCNGEDISQEDFNDIMGNVLYSISLKIEALQDHEKQRLFFVPMLIKFIIDKMIFYPVVKSLYGQGCYMVGFKWAGGGARKLFDFLGGELSDSNPTRYFWEWDIRRMDQAAKAAQIAMNYGLLIKAYNQRDENFVWLKKLAAWSIDNSASKICKWFGDETWRIVVGILFSGDYLTSYSTTITSYVAFLYYLIHLEEIVKHKNQLTYLEPLQKLIQNTTAKFFGDDGISGFDRSLQKIVYMSKSMLEKRTKIGLEAPDLSYPSFEEVLKVECGLELKLSDSEEYGYLYSVVNRQCDFVVKGPKILKRHFLRTVIRDEVTIVSFRPTSIWKVGNPVSVDHSPESQLVRLIGHMWDTHGNNRRQYEILCEIFESICHQHQIKDVDSKLTAMLNAVNDPDSPNYHAMKDFVGSVKKNFGIETSHMKDLKTLIAKPSQQYLSKIFNRYDKTFEEKFEIKSWDELQAEEGADPYWWGGAYIG